MPPSLLVEVWRGVYPWYYWSKNKKGTAHDILQEYQGYTPRQTPTSRDGGIYAKHTEIHL